MKLGPGGTLIGTQISNLVGGAPAALDTLNELAAAIDDDASYAASITNALAAKAPLASPALTGIATCHSLRPSGQIDLDNSKFITF